MQIPSKVIIKVVTLYSGFGFTWILLSDYLVDIMFSRSTDFYYKLQNTKGIFFVILSSTVIFLLLYREKQNQSQLRNHIKDFESSIETSLQEKTILVAEIHHRVKNNLAIICAFLELQKDYISNDPSDPGLRAFSKSINRVKTMSILHEILYEKPGSVQIKFGNFLESHWNYVQRTSEFYNFQLGGRVDFKTDCLSENLDFGLGVNLGIITNELILQSLEFSFAPTDEKASITISLFNKDNQYHYRFEDNGSRILPTEWRNGLEMQILESVSSQMKGDIVLGKGPGLEFSLVFPMK